MAYTNHIDDGCLGSSVVCHCLDATGHLHAYTGEQLSMFPFLFFREIVASRPRTCDRPESTMTSIDKLLVLFLISRTCTKCACIIVCTGAVCQRQPTQRMTKSSSSAPSRIFLSSAAQLGTLHHQTNGFFL